MLFRSRFNSLEASDQRFLMDPEASAVSTVQAAAVMAAADNDVRAAFELQNQGYTYDEIVEMFNAAGIDATKAQLRTRMSRFRAATRGVQSE